MKYIAFIYKDNDSNDYVAVVPDLNFVSSFGSTFNEAVKMIKEAAMLYVEDIDELPEPRKLDELLSLDDELIPKNATPKKIDVSNQKTKRVNITLREDVLKKMQKRVLEDYEGNRSKYIQTLILNDLNKSSKNANAQ
jgi:predicted RNase H-like HicB family nuclease